MQYERMKWEMEAEGCETSWGSRGGDVVEVLRLIFLAACVAAIPK